MACTGPNVTVQTRPPNMGSGKNLHGDDAWMSIVEFNDNFPTEFRRNYHSTTPKQAVCINREPILPDEVQFFPLLVVICFFIFMFTLSRLVWELKLPDITQHLICDKSGLLLVAQAICLAVTGASSWMTLAIRWMISPDCGCSLGWLREAASNWACQHSTFPYPIDGKPMNSHSRQGSTPKVVHDLMTWAEWLWFLPGDVTRVCDQCQW